MMRGVFKMKTSDLFLMQPNQGKTILENQELPRVFNVEDEMDDLICGLEKRKRVQDQVIWIDVMNGTERGDESRK
jgi:hypothetical protein